jgi:hypothetical protein
MLVDRCPAEFRRRRHSPTHHGQLAFGADVAHDRSGIVGEDAGHRRQVADVSIYDAEQIDDRGLVGGDAVEIVVPLGP